MTDAPSPADPGPADPLADDVLVRATFESAPDGLVVLAADGRLLAYNRRFLDLWRFPPDMLARRDAAEMRQYTATQLRDPQAYLDSLPLLATADRSQVFDTLTLADGRVYERHVSPLQVPGESGAVVVRWRDITARQQAEQALAETQARMAALFEHALNAILLAADDGRYVDANPAACRLLGYRRDELVGRAVADVVVPGPQDTAEAWADFLQTGQAQGRTQLRRRDGAIVDVQFNAVANMLPGVHLSILSDLSEVLRAQQRQQELTAMLDLAMLDADMVYWDIDLVADRISSINQHLHTMLGYQPGDGGDAPGFWDDLVHPDDRAARDLAWEDHVQGRRDIYEAEFRMRHQQGHWVWLHGRGRAVARDAQGMATRVVGMRINITHQKRTEERLHSLAHTDSLTGLLNRRRMAELVSDEAARSSRHGHPMALLMIDLDHFKAVNDRLGHAGGDDVLRAFATTAQSVMRQGDALARVGGEEFAAMLPQTNQAGAEALARRLLQQVHARPARVNGHEVAYTVSIGLAVSPPDNPVAEAFERLMAQADQALYQAKALGRDRVAVA